MLQNCDNSAAYPTTKVMGPQRFRLMARRCQRQSHLDDRFHEPCVVELVVCWRIPCFAVGETRSGIMAGWRRAVELAMTDGEMERLTALSRSRTEPASRVSRAQMLLAYRENPSFCAVGQR